LWKPFVPALTSKARLCISRREFRHTSGPLHPFVFLVARGFPARSWSEAHAILRPNRATPISPSPNPNSSHDAGSRDFCQGCSKHAGSPDKRTENRRKSTRPYQSSDPKVAKNIAVICYRSNSSIVVNAVRRSKGTFVDLNVGVNTVGIEKALDLR
jgi:hypothetical protein